MRREDEVNEKKNESFSRGEPNRKSLAKDRNTWKIGCGTVWDKIKSEETSELNENNNNTIRYAL